MLPAVIGCANPSAVRRTMRAAPDGPPPVVATAYTCGCPDVLAVTFADHPTADCLATIDLDGRVNLGELGSVRVEGLTADAAREEIARRLGMNPERVNVALAAARTGRLYLHGPEQNRMRTVVYAGPERLIAFLQRVGALRPGCSDWRDVCVVRPNVAAGEKTQVFRADLEAILLDHDPATDVTLQPGDQVYVGETRRSSFARLLPVWLKPTYRTLCGLARR